MSPVHNRCRNCSQSLHLQQKFCHECGQRTDTHRIDYHFLVHEVQHGVFHVDKGIIYTLKELLIRPGHTIREYVDGKRKDHFKPALLIMVLATVTILLNQWWNSGAVLLQGKVELSQSAEAADLRQKQVVKTAQSVIHNVSAVMEWINGHYSVSALLMVPLLAFCFWLVFRPYKQNLPEWLIISTFITAQGMFLYIMLIVLPKQWLDLSFLFLLLINIYIIWTVTQYFSPKPRVQTVARTVGALALYYAVLLLSIIVFVLTVVFNSTRS